MKILFISSGNKKGEISTIVYNQGESIRNENVEIDYYTINNRGLFGYIIHIFKLKRYLLGKSYNLLHSHYGLSGVVAILAKKSKQQLIVSLMGSDLYGNVNSTGNTTLKGKLLSKLNVISTSYANHIIVKSKSLAQIIPNKNVSIIPNGIDLDKYYDINKEEAQKMLGWDMTINHILFLADPDRPEKNYQFVNKLRNHFPLHDLEFHVLRDIPPNQVIYHYNAADVCLLVSYYEGSPNVIKEAMACNCPIISTDVGDVKELFDGIFGYYITTLNVWDLNEKISEALKYASIYKKTEGRNRIIELGLDDHNIAKNLLCVYERILNNG